MIAIELILNIVLLGVSCKRSDLTELVAMVAFIYLRFTPKYFSSPLNICDFVAAIFLLFLVFSKVVVLYVP